MEAQLAVTRAFNFRLLRNLRGRHVELVRELHGVVNGKDVSDFALGRRAIGEWKARAIEHQLNLPLEWLDRDYHAFFGATKAQHEIVDLIFRGA